MWMWSSCKKKPKLGQEQNFIYVALHTNLHRRDKTNLAKFWPLLVTMDSFQPQKVRLHNGDCVTLLLLSWSQQVFILARDSDFWLSSSHQMFTSRC